MKSKVVTREEALSRIHDGQTIMFGDWHGEFAADEIIDGMLEKGIKDIDAIAVSAGMADQGVGKLIKRHCEENEIERPEDLRVRTVANKSKMKVAIIQAIDRKVALDDIALSKGIEFGELLDEVEAIVYSGTKLNIDYFLEEIMDEDHMLDIYDYFKESTTDKIDDALDELGDEFTEEEVRLVRIKFISEMAN